MHQERGVLKKQEEEKQKSSSHEEQIYTHLLIPQSGTTEVIPRSVPRRRALGLQDPPNALWSGAKAHVQS